MKVNNRRHAKMSRKASAILALCVVLVLTIAVGYLGVHGTDPYLCGQGTQQAAALAAHHRRGQLASEHRTWP